VKPNPYINIHIRRIIVDPKPQPEAEPNTSHATHLPVTRAEVPDPIVALRPKQARRAARQRIATPAPIRATYPGGATKSEWEHAQANVDGGSAPISLTEEQVREQNEAASRWAERAEREHNARRAAPKDSAPARTTTITSKFNVKK
jgi:hypothetical protein